MLCSFYFKLLFTLQTSKGQGVLPLYLLPLRLCHGPAAQLTVPRDTPQFCRMLLWSFFTKYNIGKLNLLSKTDISKTAWINPCLPDSCHVTAWSRWHMTCWVGSSHSSDHPAMFIDLVSCEGEDKIFLICHVTT